MEVLRLFYYSPLPFAGIIQTGSEGLPAFRQGLSAQWAPLAIFVILLLKDSNDVNSFLSTIATGWEKETNITSTRKNI